VSDLTFGRAAGDEQRREVFALRGRTVVDAGWVAEADLPDGLERDQLDDRATQLVALSAGRVVGALRVAWDRGDVEAELRAHGLDLAVDGTMVLGRLVVDRPWRRRSRAVTVGLYAELVRLALELGMERGVSFVTESAIRWYRVSGIPLKVVGPPREVTGMPRSPAVVDVDVLRDFLASATDAERRAMPATDGRA
jgi:N-acyl-L-homoserine lactone synthetase